MALEWFEPDILPSDAPADLPDWVDSYADFMAELQENFGPHDPAGDAEMQLEQLHMRDSQRINKYIVEFQRLATQVRGWGDGALRRQFYNGLPARIKDEVSRAGKPATLLELKSLSQVIDSRYWERKGEVSRETTHKASSTQPASSQSSSNPRASSSSSAPKTTNKSSAQSSSSSASKNPDISSKLGKDGRLTAEERKHRLDNNLCLFSGGSGHGTASCPKSTSRAAKARAASITPEAKLEAPDKAKK